jgi:hypothetical protein
MQTTHTPARLAVAFILTGCGPVVINIDATESGGTGLPSDESGPEGSTTGIGESMTGPMDTSTSTDGASESGDSTTASESSTGSTTGEPSEGCILPEVSTSWCFNQRIVAQILGCKTSNDPESCYRAIVAQYEVGDWEILAAGDCDTAIDGPECADAYNACSSGDGGPLGCWWAPGEGIPECVERATGQGLDEQDAATWCADMESVWVIGCTTRSAYLECDLGCALPCSHGRDCAGPSGSEVCTEPCGSCDPPLVFGDPWTTTACSGDLCALACVDGSCPPLYTCGQDGACWPSA